MRYPIARGGAAPLLALFGATAANSYVELLDDAVIARMGLAQYRIARSDIVAARPSAWPLLGGIGWRVGPNALALIGARRGVVEFRLARPYTHRIALVPMRFMRLFVSLDAPAAFLAALGAPATSTP